MIIKWIKQLKCRLFGHTCSIVNIELDYAPVHIKPLDNTKNNIPPEIMLKHMALLIRPPLVKLDKPRTVSYKLCHHCRKEFHDY